MTKYFALVNATAGSVPPDAATALEEALGELECRCQVHVIEPQDFAELLASPDRLPDDGTVIVWGGDGTAAAVMRAVRGRNVNVLPLPGGTMNMLHRTVHGGAYEWRDCLTRSLELNTPRHIPAGQTGDETFYVAAIVGNLTKLAEPREAVRDGDFLTALQRLGELDTEDLEPHLDLELFLEGQPEATLTASAATFEVALKGDRPVYEVGAISVEGPLRLAGIVAETIAMGWRDAPHVAFHRADRIIVRHRHGDPVLATLDGERTELPDGAEFTLEAEGARILAAT